MTQLIMCLQCKLEDMNLIPHNSLFKKLEVGVMAHWINYFSCKYEDLHLEHQNPCKVGCSNRHLQSKSQHSYNETEDQERRILGNSQESYPGICSGDITRNCVKARWKARTNIQCCHLTFTCVYDLQKPILTYTNMHTSDTPKKVWLSFC